MDKAGEARSGAGRGSCATVAMALCLSLGLAGLGGCSLVSEQARDPDPPSSAAETISNGFPNLASVPSAPPPVSSREEITRLDAALRADRAKADYSAARELSVPEPGGLAAVLFFAPGSAEISPEDHDLIASLVRLREARGGAIRVVGYASPGVVGDDVLERRLTNLEMSYRRAAAVARDMIALGAPAGNVVIEAHGDAQALGLTGRPGGEVTARRVEVFLEDS